MKTSELLRKAAGEIRRRGWHQGDYGSDRDNREGCAVCALGAMNVVLDDNPWGGSVVDVPEAAAYFTDAVSFYTVHGWNDTEGRTVEEVLEKFEEAAQAAEREGD